MATDSPLLLSSQAPPPAEPAGAYCADCTAPVAGKYCSTCGQETLIETPTVKHFVQEFADQYVALEGKLGRTLRVLILKPGQLTLDYVEGRRQRYVRPLKLYLTISVIFFTLLGLLPDTNNPFVGISKSDEDHALVHFDREELEADAEAEAAIAEAREKGETPPKIERKEGLDAKVKDKAKAFAKLDPKEQNRVVRAKLADDAPYAMFFLLPYFALLLKWFYRKQKLRYGVHLLFSLHLHSFLFIVLTLGFLPLPMLLRRAVELTILVYVFLGLRRVYGGSAKRTVWRISWMALFYFIAIGTTALSGVLTAILGVDLI